MSRNHTAGPVLHLEGETFTFDTAREAVAYLRRSIKEGADRILDELTDPGPLMCECELDWVCGLCRSNGVIYTPEERMLDAWAWEQSEYDRQGGWAY